MARELDTEELLHWLAENCPNEFEIEDAEGDGTATITFSTNDEDEVHAQTPIGEQIGKLLKQRNYPAANFIVEHERIHDQIQKNPGPGDDLLSEIERANDEYKTTRDPCARCGVYSFEGNVPLDDEGEEIGDRYYCIDCIGSVSDQIEEWKEDQ
tara:strand:+ start:546 stop:1007 length:462 start_codon:yes stop_codon:yes gene_type:complete